MTHKIPDFLLEMSKQMNEQKNRGTRDPIFQVRHKSYLITEDGYNESHWEIVDVEDGTTVYHSEKDSDYTELFSYLWESQPDWLIDHAECVFDMDARDCSGEIDEDCYEKLFDEFNETFEPDYHDLPDTLKIFHMQEIEVVVKACLTESDAKEFIKRKQHDYPKLYTYVESMIFCPQMIELREWIMSLTEGE